MKVVAVSQDGLWSVIEAIDYEPGIGRSRTAKTPGDALRKNYEPNLVTPPGAGSLIGHYVMVRTMDIEKHPDYVPYVPVFPSVKSFLPKRSIPDYPLKCLVCGEENAVVVLFSSVQHRGTCPGPRAKLDRHWRP